ncbi:MAG: vitamin K epoxide reductase family protein [Pseudomonadota bacterium]
MAEKPLVLITGAAGDIGSSLSRALAHGYRVVGLDQPGKQAAIPLLPVDLSDGESVEQALQQLRERFGARIASVIHLAAYFDFTGDEHPLYEQVNVEGTRTLLRALQALEVEQFVYAGTMLVHEPCKPGERIDERQPLAPKWAYPKSKAAAEKVIAEEHGRIPYLLLHLAGVYDERRCVPTLAQQIARIYERDFTSHLYSGDPGAGQSMLHKEDMADAFRRAVDRRAELPPAETLLIGEPEAVGYGDLQDLIGRLVHGDDAWTTLRLPKPAAKLGAALQEKLEPFVPDAIDQGKKPFIRPFMVEMADDHYALDVAKARRLLGWEPRHHLADALPRLVQALKDDPLAWYRANGVMPPPWMAGTEHRGDAEALRRRHEALVRGQHARYLWAPFFNLVLGTWLLSAPPLLGLQSGLLAWSDLLSGAALLVFAALALSWRFPWARWACAAIGLWVMSAPLVFWAPTAAGYLNDTLVGALVIGFAIGLPPEPGVSPRGATSGPDTPPGWSFNPSAWTQRLPIIALALVGLHVSRYLTAYQLGHIGEVWEPFFAGGPDPKNGTEEIITSSVSEAWPVPDAGVGALTYLLEILTGVIGSRRRWRTMPWLVLLFGLMIVPLGVVSVFFIIIQPIWIGTWCTLCLVAAAAMLVQIPYSIDEILATCQFLRRRRRAGASLLAVLLWGDTDEGPREQASREFQRSPRQVVTDVWTGGVALTWNLALTLAVGVALMSSRLWLGTDGTLAHAHHLVGSLALTVVAIACAEPARTARLLNVLLGLALLVVLLVVDASAAARWASVIAAAALLGLALPRGPVRERYGGWSRWIL